MTRPRTIDGLFRLSREERRRLCVGRSQKKGYGEHIKRPVRSREELLDYLKENGFRTSRKLEAERKEDDPNTFDYRKEFGSWLIAKDEAFGPDKAFKMEITAEYLVRVVSQYGLWTSRYYRNGHKIRPDLVPSYWFVEKEFKRWSTLLYYAERYDSKRMLTLFLRLQRKLGHEPSALECEKCEIDKSRLETLFGGKKYFKYNIKWLGKKI